jgi:hypothetical protein
MRVLAILALALSLAGCNGDRIKQGINVPTKHWIAHLNAKLPSAAPADRSTAAVRS